MEKFCAERRLCVGNTYFNHKIFLKYTRVARGQDRVKVKKDMLLYEQDVRAVR